METRDWKPYWRALAVGSVVMASVFFGALVLLEHDSVRSALVQTMVTTAITAGFMVLWVRRTGHL